MTVKEYVRNIDGPMPDGRVADIVHQLMLNAIEAGCLVSGQAILDHEWAEALEVSRTPVREAIQRLHGLGLLEVAPARFTKLQSFSAETAHQEALDWSRLHQSVIASVIPAVSTDLMNRLYQARHIYQQHLADGPGQRKANFAFHRALHHATPSFGLRLGATSAAYRFRLAEAHLPHRPRDITRLHTDVIAALDRDDPAIAHHALDAWTRSLGFDARTVA